MVYFWTLGIFSYFWYISLERSCRWTVMSDMPFCMVVTTLLYLSKGTYNLQCNYIVYFFSTQQTQMWPQIYIFWKSQLQRNYTTMSLVTKQAQMWPQIYMLSPNSCTMVCSNNILTKKFIKSFQKVPKTFEKMSKYYEKAKNMLKLMKNI